MIFKRPTNKYGETPAATTPYQKAAQVWDERIGSARSQAKNWRLMAYGGLFLTATLSAALIWQSLQTKITPYIIEVNNIGEVKSVGIADVEYRPTDAQTAYHMAEFIKRIRAVSIDPVVLKQQWEAAYDFVTDQAAQVLNEYARENDPFKEIGRRSVAVEITSVVRASSDSFQVKWNERHYLSGTFQTQESYTAILTVIFQKPNDVEILRKNPLGLYVHGLNWSRDVQTLGGTK